MSPLLRKELRIVLYPDHLALASIDREFTRHGLSFRLLAKELVTDVAVEAGEPPWSGVLQALARLLPGQARRRLKATVVLSNHFMRYTLLPWSADLGGEAEELAVARHCFRNAYGEAADQWEMRISPGQAGVPILASAVDRRLPDALRAVFDDAGVALDSIQPHLMAAYNACRVRIRGRCAWFAVVERGNLCLALLQHEHWAGLRSMRLGEDWQSELPHILEREAILADCGQATGEMFLWAPEFDAVVWPGNTRWRVRKLDPPVHPGIAPEYDGRLAMAMGL